ncbi:MAG: LacI family DNA-binding transcriptional regulator [Rhodothermales bacterium]
MRPTTKDLATASGVSLATIDRVLNDRPGVKANTIEKVNAAIERIGFVRNISAANLARNKNYKFLFILPSIGDLFLKELLSQIKAAKDAFSIEMMSINVKQIQVNDPHELASFLGSLDHDEVDGIAIMAPESPQVRDALTRLFERDVHIVQLLSGKSNSDFSHFVGVDNRSAGSTAGALLGRFSKDASGKIIVIADTMLGTDSIQRRSGFDEVITNNFPQLSSLPSLETYGDLERTNQVVKTVFKNHTNITGVYILSSEPRLSLEAIKKFASEQSITIIAHERTSFTEDALRNNIIDAIIAQNPGHAVRSAIRVLKAKSDQRELMKEQDDIRIEILLKENL